MTKREEIREYVAKTLFLIAYPSWTREELNDHWDVKDYTEQDMLSATDSIFSYLHSQGVVITSNKQDWADDDNLHRRRIVEPLIK